MTRRLLPTFASAVAAATLLVACGNDLATTDSAGGGSAAASAGTVELVAAFYPLEYLARGVGGDRVDVTGLTPPGAEAHDLELTPQTLATMQETDIAVVLSGFQPAIDDAIPDLDAEVVDLAEIADRPFDEGAEDADAGTEAAAEEEEDAHAGEEEDAHAGEEGGDTDPHFWLDPTHMVEAAEMIADALSTTDPDGAEVYASNLDALTADLMALDEEAEAAFASCEVDTLVTAHDAFGYFADRYGFEIRAINGISPDQEPAAGALAEISDYVADSDITTVYTEVLLSSAVADTVAAEAGVETLVLDPIEGITEESAGSDYPEVMRANIEAVQTGQGCS